MTLDDGIYFILDGYRHTLSIDLANGTFTEEVAFEAIVRDYVAYGTDDYNSTLRIIEGRDAEGNATYTLEKGNQNRLYSIDRRSYRTQVSNNRGNWTLALIAQDGDILTYRITIPFVAYYNNMPYSMTYSVIAIVDNGEAIGEDGEYAFLFYLEEAYHPAVAVDGLDASVQMTFVYEPVQYGTGAITSVEFTIGGDDCRERRDYRQYGGHDHLHGQCGAITRERMCLPSAARPIRGSTRSRTRPLRRHKTSGYIREAALVRPH